MNTNFDAQQLIGKIREIDEVGRVTSRLNEIGIATFELVGKDYREIIRKTLEKEEKDPFSL